MNIEKLYKDTQLTGECILKPFKNSVSKFGYSFSNWTDQEKNLATKILGVLKRIIFFVAGLLGTIFTSPLVPVGMGIKSFGQHKTQQKKQSPSDHLDTNTTQNDRSPHDASPQTKDLQSSPILERRKKELCIQKVLPYPGDLSEREKSQVKTEFRNVNKLNITFRKNPSFSISIRNQDIFKSGAEVIVNAANTHLGGGGGIDGAIHAKGGTPYGKAHKKLQTKYDSQYIQGFSEIIESGLLKRKHDIDNVIIVAGPQGSTNQQKENELYSCYFNSLELTHIQKKTSLAFPSISTGIFGFPKERAAAISLRAIQNFISKYPDSQLKTISIHFLDADDLKTYLLPN